MTTITKTLLRFSSLFVLCLASLSLSAQAQNLSQKQETVLLAATEWPPYTSKHLPDQGVAAEVVIAAFKQSGLEVELQIYPWARGQAMVRSGHLHGLGIAWFTEQRNREMLYSDPFLKTEIVLIKNRHDFQDYSRVENRQGKHFAVLRGYGYMDLVPKEQVRISTLADLEQSLQMLAAGRVDLTLEEKLNAHYRLAKLPFDTQQKIEFVEPALQVKDLFITISRQHPRHKAIIQAFNQGLKQLIASGEYREILRHYTPEPGGVD